ncbi:MAG TPA: MMPL family transporter [Dehalococcoidia bacterium]|nr:MMPL family transporter [Dehalococcoidia bacterium]
MDQPEDQLEAEELGIQQTPREPFAARLLIALRWLIVPFWIGLAIAARVEVKPLQTSTEGGLIAAVPEDLPAIQAQINSFPQFGLPILSRTIVVTQYQNGLDLQAQANVASQTLQIGKMLHDTSNPNLIVAVPYWNLSLQNQPQGVQPSVVMTYLFFNADASVGESLAVAHRYASLISEATNAQYAGVTGSLAAGEEQSNKTESAFSTVEIAALIAVVLVVAIRFRAIGAALVTLVTVGIAYSVAFAALQLAEEHLGLIVPAAARPLVSVLLLGIVTDYVILFLTTYRDAYVESGTATLAAQTASSRITRTIATACLIVVAGSLALLAAQIVFLPRIAPSLAASLTIGFVVAATFTPCLLGIIGKAVFWPTLPHEVGEQMRLNQWLEHLVVRPLIALPVLAIALAGLGLAAVFVGHARLAANLISDLPSSSEPAHAAAVAEKGGLDPGLVGPTGLILNQPGIGQHLDAVTSLQDKISKEPGVKAAVGPAQTMGLLPPGVVVAPDGNAARLLLIFDSSPYSSDAIQTYRDLKSNLPDLLRSSGLDGAGFEFTGDTAVSSQIAGRSLSDAIKVSALLIAAEFVILLIFTRALLAALLLVAIAVLVTLAALGFTAFVSDAIWGSASMTFYVPIAAMVLLLSLSSDYNLFLIGQIWREREVRPMREAIATSGARASWAILTASFALAASFALLAIVPLTAFRQLAIAVSAGILADTLIVRPLVVPALLSLLGRLSTWPSKRHYSLPLDQPSD